MGSKKNLVIEDLFELNKESRSDFLITLWEHYWTPKMESYNEKKKEILDDGTNTNLLGGEKSLNGLNSE
jgi:hypothetical protein